MISILMPIYNGIEYIHESVTSILAQKYNKWELLIGINGHEPNSATYQKAKIYEKDSRIKVFDFYEIKGKSNTLNELIRYCKYEYIALLDVDDIWHHTKLEIQSKYLYIYDVIGSNCMLFGDIKGVIPKIPIREISHFHFSQVNPIINSSAIIRKPLCYWDNQWDGVEDYDLWIRLRKQNRAFYNCPEILVKHRIHSCSAFNSKGNHKKVADLLKYHELI